MKKVINIIIVISILLVNFMPLNVSAASQYTVKSMKIDGTITEIGSYETYNEALNKMNEYEASETDVACIYDSNGKIINANYATGDISGHGVINMYVNATDRANNTSSYYSQIESNWGSDVAILDYYPGAKPMYKIKISGTIGWTLASNVKLIPLTYGYRKIKIVSSIGMKVREEPNSKSKEIGDGLSKNAEVNYFDTKYVESDGYIWYKVFLDGKYGWVASNNEKWAESISTDLPTYYAVKGGILYHYYETARFGGASTNLGPAPSYLENNKRYYSFDGNYFYTKLIDMLSDYKSGTYEKAINYETPYYNYYMYLPTHSKTGYTADDFNLIIKGYELTPKDPNLVYVDNNGNFISGVKHIGVSALYNQGNSFIAFQNNYGLNAFTTFSTALNESDRGTNVYALGKNNVLSIGVCDSCKYANTVTYATVYNNLEKYASLINTSYSNPTHTFYYGSHYGNKGSGMGVKYATDPYWGEKQAEYSYLKDDGFGGNEYNANIIGVKISDIALNVYKRPYSNSDVIYTLKNNAKNQLVANMPMIVLGTIVTKENNVETKWYKVNTDTALDDKQNIISTSKYEFNKSYGYVKAESIYISNSDDVPELNDSGYLETTGLFHLENLTFDDNDLLNFKGFLTVHGTNNLVEYEPKYFVKFVNQNEPKEYIKPLSSTTDIPFDAPNEDGYDYSGSWFSGSLDLSDIEQGDYTIYVIARINGYETTALLSNKFFNRNVTTKFTSSKNGKVRGYQFKSNYYDNKIPLELFIRNGGLISDKITPTTDNMYNQYHTIELKDGYLNLVGTSHNVGGDYSPNKEIERKLFLTNIDTLENAMVVDTELVEEKPYEVSLRVSDGFSKANAWYQVKLDISSLEKGTYALYIKTKTSEVDDYGEVNDILFSNITTSMEINDKKYKIIRNKDKRYRLELVIE